MTLILTYGSWTLKRMCVLVRVFLKRKEPDKGHTLVSEFDLLWLIAPGSSKHLRNVLSFWQSLPYIAETASEAWWSPLLAIQNMVLTAACAICLVCCFILSESEDVMAIIKVCVRCFISVFTFYGLIIIAIFS